jgi:hypothetical protein
VLRFGSVKVRFTVNVIYLQTSVLRAMLQVKVADQKVHLPVAEKERAVAVVATEETITAVRVIVAEELQVRVVPAKVVQAVPVEIIEAETLLTEVLVNN